MTPESDAPDFQDSRVPDGGVAIPALSAREMPNPTQKPLLGVLKTPLRAFRSVAPGKRFWHGPADLRPPFWAGQASFLCARRVRGHGVGPNQDLRQIQ
jgi:hypothetical protein